MCVVFLDYKTGTNSDSGNSRDFNYRGDDEFYCGACNRERIKCDCQEECFSQVISMIQSSLYQYNIDNFCKNYYCDPIFMDLAECQYQDCLADDAS